MNVKTSILEALDRSAEVGSGELARRLGISRQSAHAHLRALVRSGVLERVGAGRGTRYRRAPQVLFSSLSKRDGLSEDLIWKQVESNPEVRSLPEQARSILHYALTEMVNNAIDHSNADSVSVRVFDRGSAIAFEVADDGVGIFEHVAATRGLRSPFEAIAELQKGKVTTMPEAHTGEGIFFTSKVGDKMTIESGGTRWVIDNRRGDQSVETAPRRDGTLVAFEVERETTRSTEAVFAAFTNEDLRFSRTRPSIRLFREADEMVSRSEARRLLAGLEKFEEVELDFQGVRGVGQGFADEVFRVWQQANPHTRLIPMHANSAVRFMIERARSTAMKSSGLPTEQMPGASTVSVSSDGVKTRTTG